MTQINLEIEEVDTGLSNNTKLLNKQNGLEKDEEDNAIRIKWKSAANHALETQRSWKLIDGSIDEIRWSSRDDCWRWIKRVLTIGNIGVIVVCFCLLMGSTYVCFRR